MNMQSIFARPMVLVFTLLLATCISIVAAALRIYQIPMGLLPQDAIKFTAVPWSHFLHALSGLLFGLLGPVQFAGALKHRFGRLHRISGRVFVVAGIGLGLSSLRLVAVFPDVSTWLLAVTRIIAGLALCASLILALVAISERRVEQHRAWMIRAYAIGMGSATISFIMLPIFLIRGEAPTGYAADLLFVLSWAINLTIAAWIIRRLATRPLAIPQV
jgi:MFS family permease